MEIRPATPDDVPAVLPMVRAVCAFHEQLDPAKYSFRGDPGAMYDDWLRKRARDPESVFLVADAGPALSLPKGPDEQDVARRKLVGFIIGTVVDEIPIYRVTRYGFLHDLWVEERYRHEGVGRQLVTEAVARFREIGVPQVRLDTAFANEAARGLFRTCGFRPSIVEMLMEL
jgi:ribosomal protein S18 acetylase RimI-like enzyme